MLVENQLVEVKWHPRNKKRLESLGYEYTGIGTSVFVKVEDLSDGCKSFVAVVCDYCGKQYKKRYKDCLNQRQNGKDCCYNCVHTKISETNINKYGGKSPFCSPEVVRKSEETFMNNYGVTHPFKSEKIKSKIRQTCLDRYGVPRASQSEEVKTKMKETCQAKYGKDFALQSEQIRQKIQSTCIDRYGGKTPLASKIVRDKVATTNLKKYGSVYPLGNKEFREAAMRKRQANNSFPTSKPEQEMVQLLNKMYGAENCYPQYVLDEISFDCLLKIDNVEIDCEFDGRFWHQDRHKDMKRDYYTISKGYKVLRFRGDNKSPTVEQIKQGVDYLVNSEHHHLIIEI